MGCDITGPNEDEFGSLRKLSSLRKLGGQHEPNSNQVVMPDEK
jgi:hypothetical protein